ncbi:MAG: hypothetical protein QOD78_2259 [Chloroflexota bacterium]|jgi:hypothetical protein|nr:hypothetical protein [Chloroflexota bacterium]MEA2612752.1 hypothetical protein [Chloroflexota bacterium]
MARRSMKLPKDQLMEPEDRTGTIGSSEDDVEGHGLPLTAPPSLGQRSPGGHGGEVRPSTDDGDDVEGHRSN